MQKSKKPLEFSKKLCVWSWGLMALSVTFEFALSWTGRGSMSDVVMALITFVTAFINGGYIAQNVIRDTNLNNNGIHMPQGGDKHYIEKEPSYVDARQEEQGI